MNISHIIYWHRWKTIFVSENLILSSSYQSVFSFQNLVMFDELTPQDFAFKARDVFNKNAVNMNGQQRYNADYYAIQRVHAHMKSWKKGGSIFIRTARDIMQALAIVTPYNSETANKMSMLSKSILACLDKIVKDYVKVCVLLVLECEL